MRFKKKQSMIGSRVVEIELMKKVIKPWIFDENQWILSYFDHIPVQKCLYYRFHVTNIANHYSRSSVNGF